jgi:ParB family chromosome partitioning protein
MATRKVQKKRPVTKSGRPRKRKGVTLEPTQLGPGALTVTTPEGPAAALASAVAADGGQVLGMYREPLGGHIQILCALPIDQVERTPFQRDVSDTHVRKLTLAMDKTRRYLDPIIAVRVGDKAYQTPNGGHRLTALKELGAQAVIALLIPEPEVQYQILALNIEKAHNLREKALEVKRMYESLVEHAPDRVESACALEFEEPMLPTLGFAYEERGRFSGGAYSSVLRKVDGFFDAPLREAVAMRRARIDKLLALDDAVSGAVERLKAAGLHSPYLRPFVVARVNPLRFMKGSVPPFDELMATMTKRATGLDAGKIKPSDIASSGGPPADED